MSNNNNNTQNSAKSQDNNAVVTTGAVINAAEVISKSDKAVVVKYDFGGKSCTGVMHVSQFPSTDRNVRDQMFSDAVVGNKYDGLVAEVEPADKAQGRRYTSVRLSGRAFVAKQQEQQRQTAQQERQNRESAHANAVTSVDGKVVKAVITKLAFSKDPATRQDTSHYFGAFLQCEVDGVKLSGLLHTSRMLGNDRPQRLADSQTAGTVFEVVATVTDKGISFSEEGVKGAKEKAVADDRAAKQSAESDSFLTLVRDALAAGTAGKMPFQAKVSENRLDDGQGISAVACGLTVEVSSDDLGIPAKNLRGIGHQVKLVAVSEKDGVVTAKRYTKGS